MSADEMGGFNRVPRRVKSKRTIVALFGLSLMAGLSMARAEELRVFAAGSLRLAFDEIIAAFAQQSGATLVLTYGPSGKLREKIEAGLVPQIFASAATEHVETLHRSGVFHAPVVFAHNALCLMGARGIEVSEESAVDTILDPRIRLGTSQPRSDPAGDYTWRMFREIDKLRPGAFKILDQKAQRLTGLEVDHKQKTLPYAAIFEAQRVDVFISYCTNAAATAKAVAGLTWARFPDNVNNHGTYALGVARTAGREAEAFAAFVTGPEGQAILRRHGFH